MLHSHLDNHDWNCAKDIKNDLYVDNLISGSDSEEEALQCYNVARSIMAEANFNLRSWASNSNDLQTQATSDNIAATNDVINLLGLKWSPSSDTLGLNPKLTSYHPGIYTKREVLQQACKTYDPLNLISPVTIKAKICKSCGNSTWNGTNHYQRNLARLGLLLSKRWKAPLRLNCQDVTSNTRN